MTKAGEKELRTYTSTELKQVVVFKRRLTWALLCEIGRLRFEQRWDINSIQKFFKQHYQLDLGPRRYYDWCDLYEAVCRAWWKKYPHLLKKKLAQLAERTYLTDYTEDTTKGPVLRIFVAGIGLGLINRVVLTSKSDAIRPLLAEVKALYGTPTLIVCDDDDTIKNACGAVWPEVPVQACFEHLLRDIIKTFLTRPKDQAGSVLGKVKYRKTLKALLINLKSKHPGPWPEHGEDLRELIEVLLFRPPGGDHTRPRALQKLGLFEEVYTQLNYLFRAIQGQKLPTDKTVPGLQAWHDLKAQLPPDQAFQGLKDKRLLKGPFFRALLQVKKLVDAVHQDSRTGQALTDWRSALKAVNRLRSLHWALKIHQLKKFEKKCPQGLSVDQQRELKRLKAMLKQQLARHRREVLPLTTGTATVPTQAAAVLQKIIKTWHHQGRKDSRFQTASSQLKKAAPNLLHFLNFLTAPAAQQEIEGQNNLLKKVFRQQSGNVHSRYLFVYHAEGISTVLNFHNKTGDLSPIQRLGINIRLDPSILAELSWQEVHQAQKELMELRQPRRKYLKLRKKGLSELRAESTPKWLRMVMKAIRS